MAMLLKFDFFTTCYELASTFCCTVWSLNEEINRKHATSTWTVMSAPLQAYICVQGK
jgi:hypothetical protein